MKPEIFRGVHEVRIPVPVPMESLDSRRSLCVRLAVRAPLVAPRCSWPSREGRALTAMSSSRIRLVQVFCLAPRGWIAQLDLGGGRNSQAPARESEAHPLAPNPLAPGWPQATDAD